MQGHMVMVPFAPETLARLLVHRCRLDEPIDEVVARLLREVGDKHTGPLASVQKDASETRLGGRRVSYTLLGRVLTATDANRALVDILRALQVRDAAFLERLAPRVTGRRRRHLARVREQVYPGRPDLAQYTAEVTPGWFLGTNIANREKELILRTACEIAGLVFGHDLKIAL